MFLKDFYKNGIAYLLNTFIIVAVPEKGAER